MNELHLRVFDCDSCRRKIRILLSTSEEYAPRYCPACGTADSLCPELGAWKRVKIENA